MNHAQLAHIWAQQSGNSRRCGTMFYDGDTIYSYGHHFPIARYVKRGRNTAVLFTTRTYSVSTAKHLSHTRRAIPARVPVFNVYDVTSPRSDKVQADYADRVRDLALRAARARLNGEFLHGLAVELAEEANSCADFFGWSWRLDVPTITPQELAAMRAKVRAANAKQAAARKARAEAAAADLADRLARWKAGENVSIHGYHKWGAENPVILRVRGAIVETSMGAQVPADHARRLWGVIQRVIERGEEYRHNGHTEHVGEFRVDRIETNGTLHAGCHVIEYPALQQCAADLGINS